jgi:ABC-type proline/glycine betaine transport system permease subunit
VVADLGPRRGKSPEPRFAIRVVSGFLSGLLWNPMELAKNGGKHMWLALFSVATAVALGLSVAAVMVQQRQEDILRG